MRKHYRIRSARIAYRKRLRRVRLPGSGFRQSHFFALSDRRDHRSLRFHLGRPLCHEPYVCHQRCLRHSRLSDGQARGGLCRYQRLHRRPLGRPAQDLSRGRHGHSPGIILNPGFSGNLPRQDPLDPLQGRRRRARREISAPIASRRSPATSRGQSLPGEFRRFSPDKHLVALCQHASVEAVFSSARRQRPASGAHCKRAGTASALWRKA